MSTLNQTVQVLATIGVFSVVFVVVWIIVVYLDKKSFRLIHSGMDKQLKSLEEQKDQMNKLLTEIIADTSKVIEMIQFKSFNNDDIIDEGIRIFKTAEREIYYIGAGGFTTHSSKWRQTVNEFIRNKNTTLIRIVDLPTNLSFIPEDRDRVNYLIWLIQRAVALEKFPERIRLYNSRKAPLWNTGFSRIFKDRKEALVFTTGTHRTGNLITENIENFYQTAKAMETAYSLDKDTILEQYFNYSNLSVIDKKLLDDLILHIDTDFDNPSEERITRDITRYAKNNNIFMR